MYNGICGIKLQVIVIYIEWTFVLKYISQFEWWMEENLDRFDVMF